VPVGRRADADSHYVAFVLVRRLVQSVVVQRGLLLLQWHSWLQRLFLLLHANVPVLVRLVDLPRWHVHRQSKQLLRQHTATDSPTRAPFVFSRVVRQQLQRGLLLLHRKQRRQWILLRDDAAVLQRQHLRLELPDGELPVRTLPMPSKHPEPGQHALARLQLLLRLLRVPVQRQLRLLFRQPRRQRLLLHVWWALREPKQLLWQRRHDHWRIQPVRQLPSRPVQQHVLRKLQWQLRLLHGPVRRQLLLLPEDLELRDIQLFQSWLRGHDQWSEQLPHHVPIR
jgi:hypothetical protein